MQNQEREEEQEEEEEKRKKEKMMMMMMMMMIFSALFSLRESFEQLISGGCTTLLGQSIRLPVFLKNDEIYREPNDDDRIRPRYLINAGRMTSL